MKADGPMLNSYVTGETMRTKREADAISRPNRIASRCGAIASARADRLSKISCQPSNSLKAKLDRLFV